LFALACCILSNLNYKYRASFDTNHYNTENIYRVNALRKVDSVIGRWGVSPGPFGGSILKDVPKINGMARLYSKDVGVKKDEHIIKEKLYFADKDLFAFFDFPLQSSAYNGFEDVSNLLISATLALKYFGRAGAR
jgi:putative ABC transport system permease protein